MLESISHSLGTIEQFSLYFIGSSLLTISFIYIYIRATPFNEIDLIKKGNISASLSFSGTIIGFSIVLAVIIRYSLNLNDLFIWGFISLLIQLFALLIISFIFKDLKIAIEEDKISYGIILMTIAIVCGIISGSCMIP